MATTAHRTNGLRRFPLPALALSAVLIFLPGCTMAVDNLSARTTMPPVDTATLSLAKPLAAIVPVEVPSPRSSTIPVYWLGVNADDIQLYREFRKSESGVEPIAEAIGTMTSSTPDDPDYFSPWSPASRVDAVISSDNIITVDISKDAFSFSVDAGVAERAVQQLVYTATAAAANAGIANDGRPSSVIILVDGHAGYLAFGHVPLGEPMRRNDKFLAPVWIIDPQQQQVVEGPSVSVTGTAAAPGSILGWRVEAVENSKTSSPSAEPRPLKAVDVSTGTTAVDGAPGLPGPFTIELNLSDGKYRISVFHRGKNGEEANVDTKAFTVGSQP